MRFLNVDERTLSECVRLCQVINLTNSSSLEFEYYTRYPNIDMKA